MSEEASKENIVLLDLILPNRILSYAKVMKGECRSKWKRVFQFGYAESHHR